jgi:single-stranded-DNA-specific exonuclease
MDLVAVSIASDIVPITGENRVLAYLGLHQLNTKPLLGLKELIEISGRKPPLTISDVVFYIGPRINAAGRLTHASESVRLLVTKNEEELKEFSVNLHERNAERRNFDKSITAAALKMIEDDSGLVNAKSTVLFKSDWHKGVIGIVASRCIETYYRPTIILTESGGKATGSARSVEGFDVHEAIAACGDLLEQYGGHMYAAGLTMPIDQVDAFRKKFEQEVSQRLLPDQLIPKLPIDRIIDFDIITPKTYSIIIQMAPFGPQNMQPTFVSEKVTLTDTARILKGQHLKLKVKQPQCSTVLDCIGFGMASFADRLNTAEPFRLAYQIEENEFRGNKSLQLMIKDIQFYD